MKRFRELGDTPISSPLPAEDVLELHAARLVLLLKHCGVKNRIDGLTKLAKLDFFVRYPEFFHQGRQGNWHPVEGGDRKQRFLDGPIQIWALGRSLLSFAFVLGINGLDKY